MGNSFKRIVFLLIVVMGLLLFMVLILPCIIDKNDSENKDIIIVVDSFVLKELMKFYAAENKYYESNGHYGTIKILKNEGLISYDFLDFSFLEYDITLTKNSYNFYLNFRNPLLPYYILKSDGTINRTGNIDELTSIIDLSENQAND